MSIVFPILLDHSLLRIAGIGAPFGLGTEAQLRAAVSRACHPCPISYALIPMSRLSSESFGTLSAISNPKTVNATLDKLLAVYPDIPAIGSPFDTGAGRLSTGLQDKRTYAIWNDQIHAGSRHLATSHSKGNKVWSSRFHQVPQNGTIEAGVAHFYELPYVRSLSCCSDCLETLLIAYHADLWCT